MENQELATTNENALTPQATLWTSLKGETPEEKIALFESINEAERLSDHLNQVIKTQNLIVQAVDITDRQTGEVIPATRVILIDDKGKSYACVSEGIKSSLNLLMGIFGNPPWEPAIPLKAVKKRGNNGFEFLTLTV